jgi:hypothetical protein
MVTMNPFHEREIKRGVLGTYGERLSAGL